MVGTVEVEGVNWRPGDPRFNQVAVCKVPRRRDTTSVAFNRPEKCQPLEGLASVPDFGQPRLIIWFQPQCVACQNSEDVFRGLVDAARPRGMTVHKVEATPELIQRFPHVTVVPLYDLVAPTSDATVCSPYGPGTTLRTVRNDLGALRAEFPTLKRGTPLTP